MTGPMMEFIRIRLGEGIGTRIHLGLLSALDVVFSDLRGILISLVGSAFYLETELLFLLPVQCFSLKF